MLRLAILLALIAGLFGCAVYYGHTRYAEGVRVTKLEWDTDRATWQHALDKQKSDAQAMLSTAQESVDAANAKAIKVAAQQEKDYATYMAGTAALAAQYATHSLRYAAPSSSRCGASGGTTVSGAAAQAQPTARTVVQLPDAIAGNLRQLTVDADKLRNAYGLCIQAVNGSPAL